MRERVSDLEVFERHVKVLVGVIDAGGVVGGVVSGFDGGKGKGKGRGGKGEKEIDVSELFFRYTLDAATDFLLGRSVDSLKIAEQEFAEAFGEVQRVQNIIARAGYVGLFFSSSVLRTLTSFDLPQCPF